MPFNIFYYLTTIFAIIVTVNGKLEIDICNRLLQYQNFLGSSGEMQGCFHNDCKLCCRNGVSSMLSEKIESIQHHNCQAWQIEIRNMTFENGQLNKDLFNLHNIIAIKISQSNVETMAGRKTNFVNIMDLELHDLQLRNLDGSILGGMTNLQSLSIKQKQLPITNVTDELLWPVFMSIVSLKLQVGLQSLDGALHSYYPLSGVEELNLSYNRLAASINADSFVQFEKVEIMNLSHSEITYLPKRVFAPLSNILKVLDLSHNSLKTIDANIFSRQAFRSPVILLEFNVWHCDCPLKSTLIRLNVRPQYLQCQSPEMLHGANIFDEEVSCKVINPTERHTTVYSTLPEIVNDEEHRQGALIQLECSNEIQKRYKTMQLGYQPFKIEKLQDTKVSISLVAANADTNFSLIWFSNRTKAVQKMFVNYDQYGLGCNGKFSNSYEVSGLKADVAYTFCLKSSSDVKVSPLNCKTFDMRSYPVHLNGSLSSVRSTDRTSAIISLSIGSVVCLVFGALVVYFIIKNKPSLLRGRSKRVICPRKSSDNIMVLPKGRHSIFALKEEIGTASMRKWSIRNSTASTHRLSLGSTLDIYETNMYERVETNGKRNSNLNNKRNSNDPLPAVPCNDKMIGDMYSTVMKKSNNNYII